MPSLPETRASLILRLPDAADAAAWDEFVAVYAPLVYRLARRHGLQPADADDLVQEVLAAVARSVENWLANGERGPFRAWLFRIARNITVNHLTRPRGRPLGTGDSNMVHYLAQHADRHSDAANDFDLEYRREVFRWASDQARTAVTERTWQAFWLTSIEDRPIDDVARQLEMSVGSVYIARSRVMARLREWAARFEDLQS
jgi:RNA polymerase sigma-70 factor (ECF subfamily)